MKSIIHKNRLNKKRKKIYLRLVKLNVCKTIQIIFINEMCESNHLQNNSIFYPTLQAANVKIQFMGFEFV